MNQQAVLMLKNDIARCAGVGSDEEGWREGCEDCGRGWPNQPVTYRRG